jgi:integrase
VTTERPGDLERWERNLANGSETYAAVSGRRLRAFCRTMGVGADALAAMDLKPLRELLEDFLARERKLGHSGEYIRSTVKAVRSWREYHDRESPRGLKIPNLRLRPRIDAEQAPTTDDLRRVLLAATPAERVAIGLVAFSGVRLQVLGNHTGTDGLKVADFPEMKVEGKRISFDRVPTIVRVRATSSKAGHTYVSFLGPEGCRYLTDHLTERARSGERITPETDLVSPKGAHKKFVTTINVGDRIRRPMRAAGVKARPYSWRSYFISKGLEGQSATGGAIPDRFIEAWAGHVGDVSSRHYSVGKPNLPSSLVEEMRGAYTKLCPFLETALDGGPPTRVDFQFKKLLAEAFGLSPTAAAQLAAGPDDEFAKRLGGLRGEAPPKSEILGGRPGEQRAVNAESVSAYLEAGWRFVAPLNSHMAVVEWGR